MNKYDYFGMIGKKHGRLLAIEMAEKRNGQIFIKFLCDCGERKEINATNVIRGLVVSCGCYGQERRIKHGLFVGGKTPSVYSVWSGMKQRCLNKKSPSWPLYGGRGIKVCKRWSNSLMAFTEDMGPRPKNTSLDRIDNDGDYLPGNCRWATLKQQMSNMRKNRWIEFNGERKTLAQWSEFYGVPYQYLQRYLKNNGTLHNYSGQSK